MRSLKFGLFGCAITALVGTIAAAGCSADGTSGDLLAKQDADPTDPSAQGPVLPSENPNPVEDEPTDAGKKDSGKDAGKADASKDAGPPPPDEGAACLTPNQIFKRTCGLCGSQEAVCLVGDDGGANKVSPYGDCTNEIAGGCHPGETEDVACGNCGTQKRTCSNSCTWTTTQCTGQPTQSCTPGSVELISAGCAADVYRQKSCKADCTWDNVSATCSAPPSFVIVPPTVGSVSSTVTALSSANVTMRGPTSGICPLTSWPSTSLPPPATPYAYIEVRNTQSKTVKVSIYNSQATGGPVIDTVMVAYDGTSAPTTEAARKNCKGSANDFGDTALTGDSDFAALSGTNAVTIAPSSSVMVYFASYDAYSAANPSATTGKIKLNVKTESVTP